MKKKLTKSDIIILVMFVVGSLSAMAYAKMMIEDNQLYHPKPFTEDEIKILSNNKSAVVIYPIFTQIAYKDKGFYAFYNKKCDESCLTITMDNPVLINASYNTGKNGFERLHQLHYPFITDIDVDQNPNILNNYKTVILLHNEYMTKKEFNAVVNHKNVVYLYPNAMYAEVKVDYTTMKMSLVKGHDYPTTNIKNGFGYVTTSQYEYDTKCNNYGWKDRPNGIGLTCYPEYLVTYDRNIFKVLKDYPDTVPPLINVTKSSIDLPFCYHNGTCNTLPRDYSVP